MDGRLNSFDRGRRVVDVFDYCNGLWFKPHEKEVASAYVRIVLEHLLRESRHLTINIFLKERGEAFLPNSNGFCLQKTPDTYDIVLFRRKRVLDLFVTLTHELVHVKQHIEDGFRIDYENNSVYWEHQHYMPLSELIRLHKEHSSTEYDLLPWEREAATLTPTLLKVCGVLLEDKTANEWQSYVDFCRTESFYQSKNAVDISA